MRFFWRHLAVLISLAGIIYRMSADVLYEVWWLTESAGSTVDLRHVYHCLIAVRLSNAHLDHGLFRRHARCSFIDRYRTCSITGGSSGGFAVRHDSCTETTFYYAATTSSFVFSRPLLALTAESFSRLPTRVLRRRAPLLTFLCSYYASARQSVFRWWLIFIVGFFSRGCCVHHGYR